MELQSKNPSTLRSVDQRETGIQGEQEEKKSNPEMASLVDKLFKSVEKRL